MQPWSTGGQTDLAHGVLLCAFDHHRAHDTRYDMTRAHATGVAPTTARPLRRRGEASAISPSGSSRAGIRNPSQADPSDGNPGHRSRIAYITASNRE